MATIVVHVLRGDHEVETAADSESRPRPIRTLTAAHHHRRHEQPQPARLDDVDLRLRRDPLSAGRGKLERMRTRLNSLPLFWRVFGTNAVVLALAFLGLVFAPVTVSVPPTATELVVLAAGLVCLAALDFALLRPAFRPLNELVETMRRHDPLSPGKRVQVDGGPAVMVLAQTFNEMLDRLESERRDSARRALLVQEGERRRIARELHDEVGQTLTGVMLQVEGLSGTIPDELREQLDELRETARQGTEEVRRIVRQLRPEALEDLGLQSALAALAAAFSEHAGVPVERRLEPGPPLSEEQELVVYRVAQEALTNVARHANASKVELRLERVDERIILTVRDDGRGLPSRALRSSHGILGMRERAMLIGAQFTITTPSGGGTEVRLSLPLNARADWDHWTTSNDLDRRGRGRRR